MYVSGELRLPEVYVSGELCVPEVCVSGELRLAEPSVSGELRVPEVCISCELRTPEICFTVESGGGKIALFNGEIVQRVENGCAAKIELEAAPRAGGNSYLLVLIHTDSATALTHFLKNGAADVLLSTKLCPVCGEAAVVVIRDLVFF